MLAVKGRVSFQSEQALMIREEDLISGGSYKRIAMVQRTLWMAFALVCALDFLVSLGRTRWNAAQMDRSCSASCRASRCECWMSMYRKTRAKRAGVAFARSTPNEYVN